MKTFEQFLFETLPDWITDHPDYKSQKSQVSNINQVSQEQMLSFIEKYLDNTVRSYNKNNNRSDIVRKNLELLGFNDIFRLEINSGSDHHQEVQYSATYSREWGTISSRVVLNCWDQVLNKLSKDENYHNLYNMFNEKITSGILMYCYHNLITLDSAAFQVELKVKIAIIDFCQKELKLKFNFPERYYMVREVLINSIAILSIKENKEKVIYVC